MHEDCTPAIVRVPTKQEYVDGEKVDREDTNHHLAFRLFWQLWKPLVDFFTGKKVNEPNGIATYHRSDAIRRTISNNLR